MSFRWQSLPSLPDPTRPYTSTFFVTPAVRAGERAMLGLGPVAPRLGGERMFARFTPTSELGVELGAELPPRKEGSASATVSPEAAATTATDPSLQHVNAAVDAASGHGSNVGVPFSGQAPLQLQPEVSKHTERRAALREDDLVLIEYEIA